MRNSYSAIASEYYDAVRHPTCANFAELSEQFLAPRLRKLLLTTGMKVLEVGAGRSSVAPIMAATESRLDNLLLLDNSSEMLEHSKLWKTHGVRFVIRDALNTELEEHSFDLIASSLGDPYNCQQFWSEMWRVAKSGGCCLFTVPSSSWSSWFRREAAMDEAEFLLNDGTAVTVPSFVLDGEQQTKMLRSTGWDVLERASYAIADLTGPLSPKLGSPMEGADRKILDGYLLRAVSR